MVRKLWKVLNVRHISEKIMLHSSTKFCWPIFNHLEVVKVSTFASLPPKNSFHRFLNKFLGNSNIEEQVCWRYKHCLVSREKWFCICRWNLGFCSFVKYSIFQKVRRRLLRNSKPSLKVTPMRSVIFLEDWSRFSTKMIFYLFRKFGIDEPCTST